MPALFGLVLTAALLPPPAAQAGSWTAALTTDNTGTTFTDGGADQAPDLPPYTPGGVPNYTITRSNNGGSGIGCSIHVVVHAQYTLTWNPADAAHPSDDPPPPNVLVLENSEASWSASAGDAQHPGTFSGKAADGFDKDGDVDDPPVAYSGSGKSVSPRTEGISLKKCHLTSRPSSSGTVTLPQITLTADASATYPLANQWYYSASATIGPYTVSIHAQPYNFRQLGSVMDGGDGTLSWNYVWSSTTGTLSDIGSGCTVYEYVSYDGNPAPPGTYFSGPPPGYAPPHPPVGPGTKSDPGGGIYANPNPTISPSPTVPGGAASAGSMNDIQDRPYSFAPPSSCVEATWTASQTYKFDDTATGEKGTVVPGPGAGPMTITRQVYMVGTPPYVPTWYYTVNKSGSTSTPIIIP